MGKVSKFSGTAMKKLGSKKSNKHLSSGGQSLAELVREATAKTLHRPDPELNQRVELFYGGTHPTRYKSSTHCSRSYASQIDIKDVI